MKLEELTIKELKQGYKYDEINGVYKCNTCDLEFVDGEIYDIDGKLYEAKLAIKRHLLKKHERNFNYLLNLDSKYNNLTSNQKELLDYFYQGLSDKEIAKILNVTTSTIRHQRFMFKEKALKAKLYLAIYEQALLNKVKEKDELIPIHKGATMVVNRYVTINEEKEHIINTCFTSLDPLKLKEFPAREKKKIVILGEIIKLFKKDKEYLEKEVNEILKGVYDDFPLIRRYLIEYGFMDRKKDCSLYWVR